MARDKYGIIKLELPDITLDDSFGNFKSFEITSLLNEEQKEIIKNVGGTKLVLLKVKVTDSDDIVTYFNGLLNKGNNYMSIIQLDCNENAKNAIGLYENSGKYYIYS